MNQFNSYNTFREVYLDNIIKGELPVMPAYYYYSIHSSGEQLSGDEFREMFTSCFDTQYNMISMEWEEPVMDLEAIHSILSSYYDVGYLYDKEGKLICIV